MENNEQNVGSQGPQVGASKINGKLIAIIAVIAVLVIAFVMFGPRSASSTVKSYINAYKDADGDKILSLMDYEGTAAIMGCMTYFSDDIDFSKFEENYEKIQDLEGEEKTAFEEAKKEMKKSINEDMKDIKEEMKDVKVKVKDVKTEKVENCKKITKVTATIESTYEGETHEEACEFYTMKKGLRHYIIYADF